MTRLFPVMLALVACGSELEGTRAVSEVTAIGDVSVLETHTPDTSEVETSVIDGGECGTALRILRVGAWPGGGVSVAVALTGPDGDPGEVDGLEATIAGAPAVIAPVAPTPGITALVLSGDDARARELVEALPDGETFVAWNGTQLVADATRDKAHVLARIMQSSADVDAPTGGEWLQIVKTLSELGGADAPLGKTLVVAGALPPVAATFSIDRLEDASAARILGRRVGFARVGACPATRGTVPLTVGGVTCTFALPEPLAYLADEPCDAAAAANDDWPFGERVDIVMTAAETAVWEARKAAKSEEDFTGAVRLGAGEPLPGVLHFRGQTSLDCARKSYNIDLAGSDARRLMPGAASDELYLVSMCKDEGYYNQLLGDRLARELDVFPLHWRLVTLYVNDENQGVYLMLEDPIEALKGDHVALASVVRRRLDQDGNPPEVEYSDTPAIALADYLRLLEHAVDPQSLESHLDLDAYLRWMALQMVLENGDYIDEVFFYGALEAGATSPWYRIMGWDPDDLWSPCHRNGRDAIPDPNGIMYCVEGDIDHILFANPIIYERLVDHVDALLDAYPIERLLTEMASVRDALFAAVKDDATAASMVELVAKDPSAATRDGFMAVVEGMMDGDLARADLWMAGLRAKIDAYRESQ